MRLFKLFVRAIFSRVTLAVLFIILQILFIYLIFSIGKHIVWIFGGFTLISIVIVLFIINSKRNPSYKIAWIIPLLLFPGFGVLIYTMYMLQFSIRNMKKRLSEEEIVSKKYLRQNNSVLNSIRKNDKYLYNLAKYVDNVSNYRIYGVNNIDYFSNCVDLYDDLLEELSKAQDYIFLEFFIIDKGYMLDGILNILKNKVKEGVEVRIMYDGMGSLFTMHKDFVSELESYGINVKIFSPLKPIISFHYNYRDHRKLIIIDGKIVYTGGFNIADEYINKRERFGYWKDNGIKLDSLVVNSYVVMFLELWNIDTNREEYNKYVRYDYSDNLDNGYVIGYGTSPFYDNQLGKRIYLDIINRAVDYVYIMSPYLILDDEMMASLSYASLRGVDVKIFMPSIPDKKLIYYLGRSYYKELLDVGIEIYEYKLGFNHSKVFLSDDMVTVVGTINLDYRSLYLHFENGCYIYKSDVIKDIKHDFKNALKNSIKISDTNIKEYSIVKRVLGKILRLLAPLLQNMKYYSLFLLFIFFFQCIIQIKEQESYYGKEE